MNFVANTTTLQFFALLRAGIWADRAIEKELFANQTDWQTIFQIAKEQAVAALVWDGIEKLPIELLPPRTLKMGWYAYVVQVEKTNQTINQRVIEIFNLYRKAGIRPILLKGAGLAARYPNPLHRGCGDIDLYVGRDDYARANRVLMAAGATNIKEEAAHHSHLTYREVSVENHRLFNEFLSIRSANRFDKLWHDRSEEKAAVSIDGQEIEVLPSSVNVQYVFLHLYRHFIFFGIGLRQVCDWAKLLDSQEVKVSELVDHKYGWQIFAHFCVEYLGLPAGKIPAYDGRNSKKTARLCAMILREGNFGYNDTYTFSARPKGYFAGKLFSLCRQFSRWGRLFRLLPKETLKYVIFYKPVVSFKLMQREIKQNP